MCSSILKPTMNNNNNNNNSKNNDYQGDLTDILRASTCSGGAAPPYATMGTTSTTSPSSSSSSSSQFHHHHHLSSVIEDYPIIRTNNNMMFGDPFSTMRDPFLHQLDIPPYMELEPLPPTPNPNPNPQEHDMMMMMMRPPAGSSNIFSNMIQISPNNNTNAPTKLLPYDSSSSSSSSSSHAMAASTATPPIKPNNSGAVLNTNMDCNNLVHNNNNNASSLQISSPRNPGLKRRKNQAKKVVCIPAPAAANSRQTGEVVPSDLWAWRKYGQKPIKGSPYPRGYYRCSSSKGCSARKQVERSRTDPNMLVITYTSEHNHPWPTQRNALAGSTRSQPSKTSNSSSKNTSEKSPKPKEDQSDNNNNNNNIIVSSPVISPSVKEEMEDIEKQLLIDDNLCDDGEFSDHPNYKPSMMMIMDDNDESNTEDFFAELGEIEADPLNLLFSTTTTQGFNAASASHHHQIQRDQSKALDPFNIFDWSGGDNSNTNNNSFEEHNNKGRL